MKNRVLYITLFFIFLSCIFSPIVSYANEEVDSNENDIYVYDYADILTKENENDLQEIAQKYEEYDVSVVFLTTNNIGNLSSPSYIKRFYKNQSFSPDGVVFFISTDKDNREVYIDTIGKCIDVLSVEQTEKILSSTSHLATRDEYYEFFCSVEKETSDFIIKTSFDDSVFIPSKTSITATIIVVVFVSFILITKHNAANKRPKAQIYLNQTFEVVSKNEVFIGDRKEIISNYYKSQNKDDDGKGKKF